VLHIFDPAKPMEMVTDASSFALGAVLLQDVACSIQEQKT
jgi:hypothetical protein